MFAADCFSGSLDSLLKPKVKIPPAESEEASLALPEEALALPKRFAPEDSLELPKMLVEDELPPKRLPAEADELLVPKRFPSVVGLRKMLPVDCLALGGSFPTAPVPKSPTALDELLVPNDSEPLAKILPPEDSFELSPKPLLEDEAEALPKRLAPEDAEELALKRLVAGAPEPLPKRFPTDDPELLPKMFAADCFSGSLDSLLKPKVKIPPAESEEASLGLPEEASALPKRFAPEDSLELPKMLVEDELPPKRLPELLPNTLAPVDAAEPPKMPPKPEPGVVLLLTSLLPGSPQASLTNETNTNKHST